MFRSRRSARPRRPDPIGHPDVRVLGAILAVALALVLTVVVDQLRPEKPTRPTFADAIPEVPSVRRSSELGPIAQLPRVSGRDNGQSVRYGDRSVWIFADTLLREPWGFLSNTGAATDDLDAGDGVTLTASDAFGGTADAPTELIPLTLAELAFEKAHAPTGPCVPAADPYCGATFGFWPGPVVADPDHHRLLVFYAKLCRNGVQGTPCSGLLGKPLGSGVAAVDMDTHRVTRLTPSNGPGIRSVEGPDPTLYFPAGSEYEAGALVVDGHVYVYGDCTLGCHVARVPLDQIGDRAKWRFYTAQRDWTADPEKATDVIAAGAAGNTVFWVSALHGWLNIYLPYASNELTAQIGGSPFGPWSPGFSLLTTDTGGKGTNYAAFGHPEYARKNGLVQYVSYYQTSSGHQRLLEITFAKP